MIIRSHRRGRWQWLRPALLVLAAVLFVSAVVAHYLHYKQWLDRACLRDTPYCHASILGVMVESIFATLVLTVAIGLLVWILPTIGSWRDGEYDAAGMIGRCLAFVVLSAAVTAMWWYVAKAPWLVP